MSNLAPQIQKAVDETVIFIHIPKTAGSSVRSLIAQNYDLSQVFTFSGLPDGREWYWSRDEDYYSQFSLIHGHEVFGVHKSLPQPYRYFTFLREPIARYFSDFFFAKDYPPHRLYAKIKSGEMDALAYADLCNQKVYFNNLMTQYIAGRFLEPVTAETLKLAKHNLEHEIVGIGLAEKFDESALRLARLFRWQHPFFISKNISPEKLDKVPDDARKKVEETHGYDIELYQFASELYDKQCASDPATFAPALTQYRQVLAKLHDGYNQQRHRIYTVNDGTDPELNSLNAVWDGADTPNEVLGEEVTALRAYLGGD
ncbi:MAG: sulfotransferase family 2 domain-containing protein [Alphaproteobacteria bacterium]|jgi:hypothetical protein|nr:sulfotransferase family 2 domain-containing protein [Alphaproteobacteria bacterium]